MLTLFRETPEIYFLLTISPRVGTPPACMRRDEPLTSCDRRLSDLFRI